MRTASEQIQSLVTRIARLEKVSSSSIPFNQKQKRMDGGFYRAYQELVKKQMNGELTEEEFDKALTKLENRFNRAESEAYSNKEYENEELISTRMQKKSFKKVKFINQRFQNNHFINCDFTDCEFIGVDYSKGSLENSMFTDCLFRNTTFFETDFQGVRFIGGVRFDNCDFTKAKNLRLIKNQEALTHKQVRNLLEQKLTAGDRAYFELLQRNIGQDVTSIFKKIEEEKRKRREKHEERLKEQEEKRKKEEERDRRYINRQMYKYHLKQEEHKKYKQRIKITSELRKRIENAKSDKELEALAFEVGALQADPEYAKNQHQNYLKRLQETIESKYSLVGKGLRSLKRLFSRGKRASQIRIANQMREDLHKEIRDLKGRLK